MWAGPRTNTGTGTSSLQLSFGTLVLSDAGVYTCTATISNSDLLNNDITPTSSTETITLQSECTNHIAKVCGITFSQDLGVLYSWENMTLYLKIIHFCSTNYMGQL